MEAAQRDGEALVEEGAGIAELRGHQVDDLVQVAPPRGVDLAQPAEGDPGGVLAHVGRHLLRGAVAVVLGLAGQLLAEELLHAGERGLDLMDVDRLAVAAVEQEMRALRGQPEAQRRLRPDRGRGEHRADGNPSRAPRLAHVHLRLGARGREGPGHVAAVLGTTASSRTGCAARGREGRDGRGRRVRHLDSPLLPPVHCEWTRAAQTKLVTEGPTLAGKGRHVKRLGTPAPIRGREV